MKKVKRWQAEVVAHAVQPMGVYLHRLRERMLAAGYGKGDPLFDLVAKADDAISGLWIHANYLSCPGGTLGMPDKEDDAGPPPKPMEPGENPHAAGDGLGYGLDDRRPFKPKGNNDAS